LIEILKKMLHMRRAVCRR